MTEFSRLVSYKMFTVVHPLGYRAIFIPRTSTTDLSNSTYLVFLSMEAISRLDGRGDGFRVAG